MMTLAVQFLSFHNTFMTTSSEGLMLCAFFLKENFPFSTDALVS